MTTRSLFATRFYEADLGEDSLTESIEIKIFDPQEEWSPVE